VGGREEEGERGVERGEGWGGDRRGSGLERGGEGDRRGGG